MLQGMPRLFLARQEASEESLAMNLVLGFGPFVLFALLSRLSADLALWIAFAAAFVVTIRDFIERPQLRLLDGICLPLFGGLALWRGFFDPGLSLAALRTIVDLALTIAIAVSLARRKPFSLQYAGKAGWSDAAFLRVNYRISLVWLGAFAAMALADGAVTFANQPQDLGTGINVLALAAAIIFTLRYPAAARR
jgi:hypothetical protein